MDYKDINDYELVYLIRDEDDNYKDLLFEKYYPVISSISNKYYYKYKNILDEYNDLYQEGIIGFNYAIDRFDSHKNVSFYSYALLCIESRIKDYIRKLKRNKNLIVKSALSFSTLVGDDIFLEDVIATDDITYNSMVLKDKCNFLIDFKNMLTIREALVFELRFNGFSYEEISVLLEIKKANIYSYIRQIRNKFKNLNSDDCFF